MYSWFTFLVAVLIAQRLHTGYHELKRVKGDRRTCSEKGLINADKETYGSVCLHFVVQLHGLVFQRGLVGYLLLYVRLGLGLLFILALVCVDADLSLASVAHCAGTLHVFESVQVVKIVRLDPRFDLVAIIGLEQNNTRYKDDYKTRFVRLYRNNNELV